MEKLKKLLKATSESFHHGNNLAKEYLIKEDSFLTLGYDCFKSQGHFFEVIDNKVYPIDMKECTLCYGISISNITSIIEKGGWSVVSIVRDQDTKYGYYSSYYITVKPTTQSYVGRIETFMFKDDVNLNDFCSTELYYFLLSLYDIE
jgi:hypothetical protein